MRICPSCDSSEIVDYEDQDTGELTGYVLCTDCGWDGPESDLTDVE